MSKHTPGPWHVGPGLGLETKDRDTIWDANGNPVIPECTCTYEGELPDIRAEDLRLMAAAPDLLEALKGMISWYDHADLVEGEGIYDDVASARYAIAKAMGITQ